MTATSTSNRLNQAIVQRLNTPTRNIKTSIISTTANWDTISSPNFQQDQSVITTDKLNKIGLKIKGSFGLLILKKNVLVLDIAKKLKDFNLLSITESVSSISPINSRRDKLISIGGVLPSIKIAEILTAVGPKLIRRSVTRDNSRLSSLNFG